jgi:antitoxin component YwqK of YwqJK toxin-antitoxin module
MESTPPQRPIICPCRNPRSPTPDVAYYDDGGMRYRGFQLDGEMHGAWEFLRRDGSVMRSGEFDRGEQVGVWKTFDRKGKVVKETDFSKGAER